MSIISYAQNFEDVMLWRALGHIKQGRYIDIGAQDPVIDSVSLAFFENGWKGIHVEPTPHYAELLRKNRPGDTVIQAAVGEGPAILRFFEIPETGISTADSDIAHQHRERGFHVQEIAVPCIALAEIFDVCRGQEIHWLKIDVEGFERQVLSSWGSSTARPWIVVIESTLPLTQIQTHESWEHLVFAYGYMPVYFDGLNRYYVSNAHADLKNAFACPPNVFDEFSLNGTASATFHHLIKKQYQEKIEKISAQMMEQRQSFEREMELLSQSIAASEQRNQEQASQSGHARLAQEELLRDQANREQELVFQLQTAQQEFQRQLLDRAQREQLLAEKTSDAVQALENLLRAQARREQEVGAQVLTIAERSAQEKADLVRQSSEQERLFQQQYFDREKNYLQEIGRVQQECERLLHLQVQREEQIASQLISQKQEMWDQHRAAQKEISRLEQEKLHAEGIGKSSQQREEILQVQRKLEQEIIAQLRTSLEIEQKKNEELNRTREDLTESIRKSYEFRENLLLIQSTLEQQLSAQLRYSSDFEKNKNAELSRVREDLELLEIRLSQEKNSAQKIIDELNLSLVETLKNLGVMRNSLSWRITAPLRKLVSSSGFLLKIENKSSPISRKSTGLHENPSDGQNEIDSNRSVHWTIAEDANDYHEYEGSLSVSTSNNTMAAEVTPVQTAGPSSKTMTLTTDDLLAFNDQEFVRIVYQTLLLREPDADGLNYYLARLRKGVSKMEIISQIFNSFERRAARQEIPQLAASLRRFKMSKFPVFGRIYIYFTGSEGFCAKESKLRQIENQLFRYTEQLNGRLTHIDDQLRRHKTMMRELSEKFELNADMLSQPSPESKVESMVRGNIVPAIHVAEIFSELGKSINSRNF